MEEIEIPGEKQRQTLCYLPLSHMSWEEFESACMHACMYVCMYTYMYVCMEVCICMVVYM